MSSDLERACARNLALERREQEHGRLIHEAADRELRRIQDELDAIPPGATLLDRNLATHYIDLVTQRAELLRTL